MIRVLLSGYARDIALTNRPGRFDVDVDRGRADVVSEERTAQVELIAVDADSMQFPESWSGPPFPQRMALTVVDPTTEGLSDLMQGLAIHIANNRETPDSPMIKKLNNRLKAAYMLLKALEPGEDGTMVVPSEILARARMYQQAVEEESPAAHLGVAHDFLIENGM